MSVQEGSETKRRRRGTPWLAVLIALIMLSAVGGWQFYAWHAKAAVEYDTDAITKGDISSHVSATGTTNAIIALEVGSQASGTVAKLLVDYNTPVKRGQALAQLDQSQFQAQVDQAMAQVNNAEGTYLNSIAAEKDKAAAVTSAQAALLGYHAKYESARANVANTYANLRAARANVEKARVDLEMADENNKRNKDLLTKDLIAQNDYDTTNTAYKDDRALLGAASQQMQAAEATYKAALFTARSARMDIETARMTLASARAQHEQAVATVKANEAQVRVQKANLQQQQAQFSYTVIRSPIDGIVIDRKVTIGQTVAASFQAPDLFSLATDLKTMDIWTSVDEADIGRVRVGARATFTVDAFPNRKFRGVVNQIRQAPVTVNNVVTYTVIIRTDNHRLLLMPGMTATCSIDVETRHDVLLMPNAALRFKPSNAAREESEKEPTPGESGSPGAHRHHHDGEWRDGEHRWNGEGHRHREDDDRSEGGPRRIDTSVSSRPQHVWVIDPHDADKLVSKRVILGITDGTKTEIVKSDLKEGDKVVVGSSDQGNTPAENTKGKGGGRGMRFF